MRKASAKTKVRPKIDKLLQKALDDFPKIIKEQERNYKAREKDIKRFEKLSKQLAETQNQTLLHPWRSCPYGEHKVETHPVKVRPSRSHPVGKTTIRDYHCAKNPSGKDFLYKEEIGKIALDYFKALKIKPCPIDLGYANGKEFDDLIAGWVQYWNDILKPGELLEPNLVKALIASESDFKTTILADPKNSNSARGLMQITNMARKILGDAKGELKDHFIVATKSDLNDPNINICAGIRWLFHKRKLASGKSGVMATWFDTVKEYKGLSTVSKKRAEILWKRFFEKYEDLRACETI